MENIFENIFFLKVYLFIVNIIKKKKKREREKKIKPDKR